MEDNAIHQAGVCILCDTIIADFDGYDGYCANCLNPAETGQGSVSVIAIELLSKWQRGTDTL